MQIPDPTTGMYVLKRAVRTDGTPMGDIIPLSQLCAPVDIIPRWGGMTASPRLTCANSLEFGSHFLLNKYWNKNLFHTLHKTSTTSSTTVA